jgi:hypothetical protein
VRLRHLERLDVVAGVLFALYITALVTGTLFMARLLGAWGDGLRFNIQRWEVEHVVGHLLYDARVFLGLEAVDHEADEPVIEYIELTSQIRSAETSLQAGESSEPAALDELHRRRNEIENDVELILERRVASAIRELGLTGETPLFDDFDPVWPPVDFEFDAPPNVLATSPRDEIRLTRSDLLRPDLNLAQALDLEEEYEQRGLSALVEDVGGVGTYPSTVRPGTSYEAMLETIAHEWTHNYLFFHPLGFSYAGNDELRILNETVANIIGDEIGELAARLYPIDGRAASTDAPSSIDFRATMRALRLEVDDLLEAGQIEQAERRMEEVRQELAEGGIFIRKINQAYFAFNGSYGDRPQSSSPIGPKLAALRESAGSLARFVELARGLTSEDELDEVLSTLR